jgi:hypothetical protein
MAIVDSSKDKEEELQRGNEGQNQSTQSRHLELISDCL